MKGQNLAVETVFTVGLGIALATGVVTIFDQYQTSVSEDATEKQSQIVASELKSSMYSLEAVENGERSLDLPEELGSNEYTVEVDEDITIISNLREYSYPLNGLSARREVSGSATGGAVNIFKSGNQIRVVEG
ncbi:hypothetical protein [Candidatus Nanohalococcus occultus]|uniref:Uncharacterized protein n=1 Tax=Candidatus Nanohalococcus occultus TaxID=2978047 RepID=A0ABY8CF34_9ARCH|nr:hypothetical protein SVXNc_0827 [Candidatus Nanohaloarchaeota archaeon SVXNc]